MLAAVAISTTALGILAPILRDRGELDTEFGKYMIAAAAAGEFCPLLVISLLAVSEHGAFGHWLFVITFIFIAIVAANIALNSTLSDYDQARHTRREAGRLHGQIY